MRISLRLVNGESLINELFCNDSLMVIEMNEEYRAQIKKNSSNGSQATSASEVSTNTNSLNFSKVVEHVINGKIRYHKNHLARLYIYTTEGMLQALYSAFSVRMENVIKLSDSVLMDRTTTKEFKILLDIVCDLCSDRFCYKYLELVYGVRSVLKKLLLKISAMELDEENEDLSDICAAAIVNCETSAADLEPSKPIIAKFLSTGVSVIVCPQQRTINATSSSTQSQSSTSSATSSLGLLSYRTNETVGYVLWGASLVLSHYLMMNFDSVFLSKTKQSKCKVLEIGSGLGLCGLSILRYICQNSSTKESPIEEIVLSDFSLPILKNLSYQLELNICDTEKSKIPRVDVLRIDWDALSPDILNGNGSGKGFDVIIGSDLICKESDCHGVAKTLHHYLEYPHGVAYIINGSSKSRYGSERFFEILQSAPYNFNIKEEILNTSKGNEMESVPEPWLLSSHSAKEGFDPFEHEGIFVGSAESYMRYEIRYRV